MKSGTLFENREQLFEIEKLFYIPQFQIKMIISQKEMASPSQVRIGWREQVGYRHGTRKNKACKTYSTRRILCAKRALPNFARARLFDMTVSLPTSGLIAPRSNCFAPLEGRAAWERRELPSSRGSRQIKMDATRPSCQVRKPEFGRRKGGGELSKKLSYRVLQSR